MKILIINTAYKRGGAAGIAQALHQMLNFLDGCESLFAYGRGVQPRDLRAVRFSLQAEVYLHAFLTRATGFQGYGTWLSTRRLTQLIRQWKPDVIHFHNIHGYYLDLSIVKEVGDLGIPVVWTLHDVWSLTGRCSFFLDCDHWRTGCGKCPYPREYPKAYFDSSSWMWRRKRKLLWNVNVWNPVIVTPSRWLADLVREVATTHRVVVIPNGIDTQLFQPRDRQEARRKLGLPSDKKIVLFAATKLGEKRKGARYFFESLPYVRTGRWMAVTVGKTVNLPTALEGGADIKQLGYLSGRESMADAYNAADLFCITSLADNLPTTVLESMSCGTPVVGFAVGGIPEQVTEDCGRLVPPGDARALGMAITALLNDDQLRRTMGTRCRERAMREYSLERFLERYLQLYQELSGCAG